MIELPDMEPEAWARAASGLILPARLARGQCSQRPKAMDFFSGAGGTSLGFIQAGFEVIAGVENSVEAAITYATNLCRYGQMQFVWITEEARLEMERYLTRTYRKQGYRLEDGELVSDEKFHGAPVMAAGSGWIKHEPDSTPGVSYIFFGDCRQLASQAILDVLDMKQGDLDAVAGSPPCQGYSISGKRQVADPRNNLVFEYARFIVELQPKAMMMEEVPGILTMQTPEGLDVIDTFTRILEDGGFAGVDALKRQMKAQGFTALRAHRQELKVKRKKVKPARAKAKKSRRPTQKELAL